MSAVKKKVSFILPSIGLGGAEKIFIELAGEINKNKNYEIELVYLTKLQNEYTLPEGLVTVCLNSKSTKAAFIPLLRYFRSSKPDVVFSGIGHLNIMLIVIKSLFNFTFKLFVRHSNILSESLPSDRHKQKLMLKLFRLYKKADKVIFQSQSMQDDFLNLIKLNNSYIINNPININKNHEASLAYNIDDSMRDTYLYVGRLSAVKQVDYLINEYSKLTSERTPKLLIIGDGDQRNKLEEMILERRLQDRVILLGAISNPYPYIKECRAMFLCSKTEGFPNVVLEAFSFNKPMLIKKHRGGTKEILDSLNLREFFLDRIDFNEIESLVSSFPKNIKERVIKRYDISSISLEYLDLIE
ncbi:glycosyltransferase [Bacillus thermotolerans]|uniref:glycosyltransferase n=1 Tax=Bacillus thermotolerans TaxID=1221996 RepID=UPI000582825E|nr:glycosyltransferase [Bacillus thermotolerans]KKB35460.1 glycosyl transferase [Bacillus thermotolerans]